MRVATPGVYILECQGGQRVEFWAGTEDLSVDFPVLVMRNLKLFVLLITRSVEERIMR